MPSVTVALGAEQLIQLKRPQRQILLGEVQGEPFELLAVSFEGDVLLCEVRYPGGCAVHDFSASWWDGFRESAPAGADVGVVHEAGGDRCREAITETLRFDLVPMKAAYQEGQRTEHGHIRIGVRGFQKPIPKKPIRSIADLSVSHKLGDPSPEPLNKVHGVLYEF